MTDRDTRTEALQIVLAAATETSMYVTEAAHSIVSNLVAAGLIVPPGLTAEMRHYAEAPVTAEWCSMVRRQLRAWADALGVPEAAADPRYCPIATPHDPHEYAYEYDRPEHLGGHTRGRYWCDGSGFDAHLGVPEAKTETEVRPTRDENDMNAQKLRALAGLCGERAGQYDVPMLDAALTLSGWADALEEAETEK